MGLGRLPAVWLRSVNQPTATGKEGERAEAISVNDSALNISPDGKYFRKVFHVASVVVAPMVAPGLASGLLCGIKLDLRFTIDL